MYLCGFSLNSLSLMALTVATGFVVDDAIVVLEAITRHLEHGKKPLEAAIIGAKEVGFTVLSISLSLVAVFIPILLMGGIVGRLFREFAVTLSAAIGVSLLISLTTTPMLCAKLLKGKPSAEEPAGRKRFFEGLSQRFFGVLLRGYERSLHFALKHHRLTMLALLATICLNVFLYVDISKGFFPQQDTGRIMGMIQTDQAASFQSTQTKLEQYVNILREDRSVASVVGFTGGGSARMFISLKPLSERNATIDQVIGKLRKKLGVVAGATLILQPVQDIRVGGRSSSALYQFTLLSDHLSDLRAWESKIRFAMTALPELVDVNTDAQDKGLQTHLTINHEIAASLGITTSQIDTVLNDAFGQRQVSTIYNPLNQYHVVLEVAPSFWQSPESLGQIYISTASGQQVPLSTLAHYEMANTPLSVSHQGQFAASTVSFNLAPNVSLGTASDAVAKMMDDLHVPDTVRGSFQGTAKVFQDSLSSQPWLILIAVLSVYIVLGILYESLIHPLTIISTLPSAGIGALLALMLYQTEFTIIALIGVILLIGIVKKNAIMMVDFAISAQRNENLPAREAILKACLLRFRPIMMTTMAAILGAIPLAIGSGDGAEFRRPLGISIVGGLVLSQILTLYTTPVVYLYMERLRTWRSKK